MEDVILIKKIDGYKDKDEILPITFNIGNVKDKEHFDKIYETLKEKGILKKDKILLGQNGITVYIKKSDITESVKILLNLDLEIYGIFSIYR